MPWIVTGNQETSPGHNDNFSCASMLCATDFIVSSSNTSLKHSRSPQIYMESNRAITTMQAILRQVLSDQAHTLALTYLSRWSNCRIQGISFEVSDVDFIYACRTDLTHFISISLANSENTDKLCWAESSNIGSSRVQGCQCWWDYIHWWEVIAPYLGCLEAIFIRG